MTAIIITIAMHVNHCDHVDSQVVYRGLTCCLPGMRIMLLEARSRLTKTKKPGQVIIRNFLHSTKSRS